MTFDLHKSVLHGNLVGAREAMMKLLESRLSYSEPVDQVEILSVIIKHPKIWVNCDIGRFLLEFLSDTTNTTSTTSSSSSSRAPTPALTIMLAQHGLRAWSAVAYRLHDGSETQVLERDRVLDHIAAASAKADAYLEEIYRDKVRGVHEIVHGQSQMLNYSDSRYQQEARKDGAFQPAIEHLYKHVPSLSGTPDSIYYNLNSSALCISSDDIFAAFRPQPPSSLLLTTSTAPAAAVPAVAIEADVDKPPTCAKRKAEEVLLCAPLVDEALELSKAVRETGRGDAKAVKLLVRGILGLLERIHSGKSRVLVESEPDFITIGKVYASLRLDAAHEDLLLSVSEAFLQTQPGPEAVGYFCTGMLTVFSAAVGCSELIHPGALLPVLRGLTSPVSRTFVKIVQLLVGFCPGVAIACLLVPGMLPSPVPVSTHNLDRSAVGSHTRNSYHLEFLQRVTRLVSDKQFIDRLVFQLMNPTKPGAYSYTDVHGKPRSYLEITKLASCADAYMLSVSVNDTQGTTTNLDELWSRNQMCIYIDGSLQPLSLTLCDAKETTDMLFSSMRRDGVVLDKEVFKCLGVILSTGPKLEFQTVESIVTSIMKLNFTSSDAATSTGAATVLHSLISKYSSQIINCAREVKSILERIATPTNMIAKAAHVAIDLLLSSNAAATI